MKALRWMGLAALAVLAVVLMRWIEGDGPLEDDCGES